MTNANSRAFGFVLLFLLAVVLALWNPLAGIASAYNSEVATGGAAIFASLKAITSALSFAQDVDLNAPIVTGSPGELVQPVLGTVERIANLLFALAIVSAVLTVVLPVSSMIGALALALGSAFSLLILLAGSSWPAALRNGATGILRLGILAAVLLPASYALAFVIGDRMTADAWDQARIVLEQGAGQLEQGTGAVGTAPIDPNVVTGETDPVPEDQGILGWFEDVWTGTVETSSSAAGAAMGVAQAVVNLPGVVSSALDLAGSLLSASVAIGSAFLVKLIVLPALILFGLVWIMRSFTGAPVVVVEPPRLITPPPPVEERILAS